MLKKNTANKSLSRLVCGIFMKTVVIACYLEDTLGTRCGKICLEKQER